MIWGFCCGHTCSLFPVHQANSRMSSVSFQLEMFALFLRRLRLPFFSIHGVWGKNKKFFPSVKALKEAIIFICVYHMVKLCQCERTQPLLSIKFGQALRCALKSPHSQQRQGTSPHCFLSSATQQGTVPLNKVTFCQLRNALCGDTSLIWLRMYSSRAQTLSPLMLS